MKTILPEQLRPRLSLLVGLISLLSCTEHAPLSPEGEQPAAASGGTGPTVRSTVPSSGPRDTTLDILVRGSGFDRESRAVWALDGVPAAKVTTNTMTFLSSRELIANITIEDDADLALYDVEVLAAGGKKGIGIEIFEITNNITTLPGLGGSYSNATGINDAGIVIGTSTDDREEQYAIRWRRVRNIWQVEKLPGGVFAGKINNKGTIVGINQALHLVLWPLQGGVVNLGHGASLDINEQETIVGWVRVEGSEPIGTVAAIWTKLSPTTWSAARRLPDLAAGASAEAIAINDAGTKVVGHAWDAEGVEHAVRWELRNGEWQIPIIIQDSRSSAVTEVNNNGELAGSGFACDFEQPGCFGRAMFWSAAEARSVLTAHEDFSITGAINDAGDVVGFAGRGDPEGTWFAFRWSPRSGVFEDMGMLIGHSYAEASDINNHKQAVGYSQSIDDFGGQFRAVLWTLRH
jgi:uncharacterized membrane protein